MNVKKAILFVILVATDYSAAGIGVRLMVVRKNKTETLGNILLRIPNREVGNQVPLDSGDIVVNVAGVKQVGKGLMQSFLFR